MNNALSRSTVNSGPKTHVTGLKAAVTIDAAIVTKTRIRVLRQDDDAAEVA